MTGDIDMARDWRPIETRPPHPKEPYEVVILPLPEECSLISYMVTTRLVDVPFEPTHWRPLTVEMRRELVKVRSLLKADARGQA